MNIQEAIELVYTKASTHLRKQNRQSLDKHGRPVYAGLHNCKCVVGALMTEAQLDITYPHWPPANYYKYLYVGLGIPYYTYSGHDQERLDFLLDRLVSIHDCEQVEEWRDKLARVYANCVLGNGPFTY